VPIAVVGQQRPGGVKFLSLLILADRQPEGRMELLRRLFFLVGAALVLLASTSTAQPPPPHSPVAGVWDLTWMTSKGPQRNGYIVVVQQGTRLRADIHGTRGAVKAAGEARGSNFVLRGSRMAVRYVLAGAVSDDQMTGSIKVMSMERQFTGLRRPEN
jgi:hypothetical protein